MRCQGLVDAEVGNQFWLAYRKRVPTRSLSWVYGLFQIRNVYPSVACSTVQVHDNFIGGKGHNRMPK